jgi:predicted transcriptional regulator
VTAILLSVRPVYAAGLLAGTKTAEVRRRFPEQPAGTTIYVYSSTPDRAVVGTLQLDGIDRPAARDVWREYEDRIQISRPSLEKYLANCDRAAVLRVSAPVLWSEPLPLHQLRGLVGVEPPQSFRYLDDDHRQAITRSQTRRHSDDLVFSH